MIATRERQPSGLAFDIKPYFPDYDDLVDLYGEKKGREMLLGKVTQELLTHVGELGRIKAFSYFYLVEGETLVEDSPAKTPIEEMFAGQEGVVAELWREVMIPGLAGMKVGASAFTLSAKADEGTFEGKYDYVYFFSKVSEEKIACFGIEVDLSKAEQVGIVNKQLAEQGWEDGQLAEQAPSDEIRSKAFFYEPGRFRAIDQAFVEIVAGVMQEMRDSFALADSEAVVEFLASEGLKLEEARRWTEEVAQLMVRRIGEGKEGDVRRIVAAAQMEVIDRYYPGLIRQAMAEGRRELLLPCGRVPLDFDLKFTAGNSLVETSTETMKCVTCPFCRQTVDAIVTVAKIKCPKCGAEADR